MPKARGDNRTGCIMADSTHSPGQASSRKHHNGQGNNGQINGRCNKSVTKSTLMSSSFNKMSLCDIEKDTSTSSTPSSSASLIMKLVKERDQLVLQAVNLYLQSNPNQSNLSDLFSPSISSTHSSRDVSISSPVPGIDESMSVSVLPVTSVTSPQIANPNVTLSPSKFQPNDGDKQTLPDSVSTCTSSSSTSTLTTSSCSTSLTTQPQPPHSPITTLTSDSVLLNEDQVRQRIEQLKVELEENDEAITAASSSASEHFHCSNCVSSAASREFDAEKMHELNGKLRNLQVENDEKNELIGELSKSLEQNNENLTKLQQDYSDLKSQLRRCKALEDEIDILNEKVRLVDRLESEVLKYREKVNELDFYKTRLDEIREENKLLHDAKIVLQDQIESLRCKSDKIPDLESQVMRLTALNNELNEQHSIDKEKISCLVDELNSCRIEKKTIVDDLAQVQTELTHLRCTLNKNTNGSNLREQLNSDATKRFLKLELEHQKLLSSVDCIRNSELINTGTTLASTSTSGNEMKCSSSNGLMNVKAVSPTASSCSSSASSYQFSSSSSACSNKRYSIDCTNGPMVNVKSYLSTIGSAVDSLDDIEDADHMHNFTPETLYETDSGCVSLVGELNHRLEKIERENYQIKLSMDTIKESEGKLTKLRDENYSLQTQITTLKGQLELSKLKLDSSESTVTTVKEDNQKLSKQIADLSNEIDKLRQDKNILLEEKAKLESNLKLTQDKLLSFSRNTLQMRNGNLNLSTDNESEVTNNITSDKNANIPKSLNNIFNTIGVTPPRASNGMTANTSTLSSNFNRGTFKSSSVNFARITTRDNSVRMMASQRANQMATVAGGGSSYQQQQQQQQPGQYSHVISHPNHTSIHLHHHHQYISNSITASTSITNSSPCHMANVINGSNGGSYHRAGSNSSSNSVIESSEQQLQQHSQQPPPLPPQHHHHYYQHNRSASNVIVTGSNGIVNSSPSLCPGDTNISSTCSISSPPAVPADHIHGHYLRVYHASHTTIGSNGNNGTLKNVTNSSQRLTGVNGTPNGRSTVNCHQNTKVSDDADDSLNSTKNSNDTSKIAVQNATSNKNNINYGNNACNGISSPSSTGPYHQLIAGQKHPIVNSPGKHIDMMSHCQSKDLQQLNDQQMLHHHLHHNVPLNHHTSHHVHHSSRSVSPNAAKDVWFEYGCV